MGAVGETTRRSLRSPEALALKSLAMHLESLTRSLRTGMLVSTSPDGPTYTVAALGSVGQRQLIVSAPMTPDRSLLAVLRGHPLFCRWLSAQTAFRFRGTILQLAFEPVPLVYLELPIAVEQHPVRRRPRVSTTLSAMLQLGDRSCEVLVVDLSLTGARIAAGDVPGLAPGAAVQLLFRLELIEDTFLLQLKCVVKAALGHTEAKHPGIEFYGLDFVELPQFDKLVLHSYVQQRLANETDWLTHLLKHRSG